jgi:hypothetical protein
MKRSAIFLLILGMMALSPISAFSLSTVYDDTVTDAGGSVGTGPLTTPPLALGDQITLGGTDRFVIKFTFGYQQPTPDGVTGPDKAEVSFYLNDGPNGDPGTLFYRSGQFSIDTTGGDHTYTLNNVLVLVPDTFTWIVEFFPPAGSANEARLLVYNPPSIGSSDPQFYWQHWGPTGWLKGAPVGTNPKWNLYAKVEADPVSKPVPAPTMTEWGIIVLVILLGIGSIYYLRKKGAA